MPLILPISQASLQPFFTEVQRYLLEELATNTQLSTDKHLPELINQLNDMIASDGKSVTAIKSLMNAIWELKSYAPQQGKDIYVMLSQYLSQLNDNNLSPLMMAIQSEPLLVESLLAAIPDDLKSNVLQQTNKHGGNALMLAARYQPSAIPILLTALPEELKSIVFQQTTKLGSNALMLAARYQPSAIPILLAALPNELKSIVFQQTTKLGNNALMLAARNQPEAIAPLLAAMTEELKLKVLQQTDVDGWNALMLATCNQSAAVISLLTTISDELKSVIFQQVTQNGWNALMLAAWNQPSTVEPLLTAIPKELKLQIFQQVNKYGNNALILAACNHPTAVEPLLAAMPEELSLQMFQQLNNYTGNAFVVNAQNQIEPLLSEPVNSWITLIMNKAPNEVKKKLFDEDDKAWFGFKLNIMPYLLATQEFKLIIELLSSGVIPETGRTFKHIISHKQQLLDYILNQEIMSSYALLKEIHDNESDSHLAKVFHSKRGLLNPKINKGILGLADTNYQKLHQNIMKKTLAESEQAADLVVSESCHTAIPSSAESLYPILNNTTSSSNSSAAISVNQDNRPLLPDFSVVAEIPCKSHYATKPLFYFDAPLKPSRHASTDFETLMSLAPKIPTTDLNTDVVDKYGSRATALGN